MPLGLADSSDGYDLAGHEKAGASVVKPGTYPITTFTLGAPLGDGAGGVGQQLCLATVVKGVQ